MKTSVNRSNSQALSSQISSQIHHHLGSSSLIATITITRRRPHHNPNLQMQIQLKPKKRRSARDSVRETMLNVSSYSSLTTDSSVFESNPMQRSFVSPFSLLHGINNNLFLHDGLLVGWLSDSLNFG